MFEFRIKYKQKNDEYLNKEKVQTEAFSFLVVIFDIIRSFVCWII